MWGGSRVAAEWQLGGHPGSVLVEKTLREKEDEKDDDEECPSRGVSNDVDSHAYWNSRNQQRRIRQQLQLSGYIIVQG